MQTSQQDNRQIHIVSLTSNFEGAGAPSSHLFVYLFTRSGKLIECQPMLCGKATVVVTNTELLNCRLFIVQSQDTRDLRTISLETMGDFHSCEVKLIRASGPHCYELSQVPETTWRSWKLESHWMIPSHPINNRYGNTMAFSRGGSFS